MRERGIVRRSLGWLAGITAAVLIVLAVLVGLARLLLPLAPDYQDQIGRFVTEATGFDVRFGTLSASWPLSGPEVRFSDVRIAMLSDERPVFDARELSVGVNVWRLIVDRRLQPGRIAVRGASVRAERLPTGCHDAPHGVPGGIRTPVGHHDARTLHREPLTDRPPNARAAARHQRHFAV